MDVAATLAEIETLPIEDRIRLVQAIWDGIEAETPPIMLREAQKKELDRRIGASDANPGDLLCRDELNARLRRRRA